MRIFRSALLALCLPTSGCLLGVEPIPPKKDGGVACDSDDTGEVIEEEDDGYADDEDPGEEDPDEELPTTVDYMDLSITAEIYGDLPIYDECQTWFTLVRDPFDEGDVTYWVWENILSVGHGIPCGGASIDIWHFGVRQGDDGTFNGNMEIDIIDSSGFFSNSGEYPEFEGTIDDSYESWSLDAEFSHDFVGADGYNYVVWFTISDR